MFCSAQDHFVCDCPIATQYHQQGKDIHNSYGKLSLPNSCYPPHNIPGKNMHEWINNYWTAEGMSGQGNANCEPVSVNFLEGPDECIFTFNIANNCKPSLPPNNDLNTKEEAQIIQAQINSLHEAQVLALQKPGKKVHFDGVEILKRTGPPRNGAPIHPPPSRDLTVHACRPPPQSAPKSTNVANPPAITGKPGAQAGDHTYQHPQGPICPVALPPKPPADDLKFHYQSAIKTGVKATDLADRALNAQITITAHKLLVTSTDVH